jgi:hypothetical protein
MPLCVYSVSVLSCVGNGLASSWSPVQGVVPTCYKIGYFRINSECAQVRGPNLSRYNNVMYRPIARQRLGKHIPAGANARNSRTQLLGNGSINTTKTIPDHIRQCFPWGPPRGYITRSSKGVVSCRELGRVLAMAVAGD